MLGFVFLFLCGTAVAQNDIITDIQIHGNRRIPADTIRARIFTRAGDIYDQNGIERDFNSLWNTGFFDDLRFEREQTPKGWILHIYVKEKPTIRDIEYVGLKSASQSDVLDKFKEAKVGLSKESQYDPTRVKKAEVVLKQLLASRGRQFATIKTEVTPIPPAAVKVTFNINEGPKVKVGKITFEGNKKVGYRYLRSAMRNLRPIGIPHSIVLENLFAKTYDATKLNEDVERVRFAYQDKGYFKAVVEDPKTKLRDVGGIHWYFPFKTYHGKVVDINIPVDEGDQYRIKAITFTGNKALPNSAALRRVFKIKDGDVFNRTAIGKGLEDLRKLYGEFGYINFTSVPDTEVDEEHKLITIKIDIDEGKPYYVRRIEFEGNTTTRDKVIRRELALEEGQLYNSRLWELSLLRLNQLQYFDTLKPDQDSEVKQNNQNNTVDITLKVHEKGKNSIGLTGGVSGLAGSFIGLNYQTNNFLGKGETLTVEANVGSRERNIVFGFTEPYLFDRPLQLGFTVFSSKFTFDQAQQANIATGQNLNLPQNFLQSLQNYAQSSTGFTLGLSYPLHRSFKRVGLTYSLDNTSITTYTQASQQLFESLAFRGISGPNALEGMVTSKLVPSFSENTIDNPVHPHNGHSLYIAADISGLGGNVRMIRPIIEWKKWYPVNKGRNSIGYRVQGSFVSGYSGVVAPPFNRFYLGGDTDIRGFDIRAISPIAFLTTNLNIGLTNPDGTPVPVDPNNPRRGSVTIPIPVQTLVYPGGDTSIVTNLEYRIPIAGPVTFAPFLDTGWDMALRQSELRLAQQELDLLNTTPFGCPGIDPITFGCIGSKTFSFNKDVKPISSTNYQTRMSTGLELQVILPIVNAPFRIYYAYNPLRLDTIATPKNYLTRDLFPPGAAGDYTFQQAEALYGSRYRLREPRKTFRFTVATTF
ncbi:MAG: outer membrane protein assembly factor BamA [Terriglobia bacterium]|nr:outer membrane protein assembly factor BamA [Terriglobia bacterium]